MTIATNNGITTIDIMQGSFGCAGCTNHYDIDPYWDRDEDTPWNEAVRGDGMSYCGIIETVERKEGESDQDFVRRARQRSGELEIEHGLQHCRQCRCEECRPSRYEDNLRSW